MGAELARHVTPGSLREMPCFSGRPCIGGPRGGNIVEDPLTYHSTSSYPSFVPSEHIMLLVASAFDPDVERPMSASSRTTSHFFKFFAEGKGIFKKTPRFIFVPVICPCIQAYTYVGNFLSSLARMHSDESIANSPPGVYSQDTDLPNLVSGNGRMYVSCQQSTTILR